MLVRQQRSGREDGVESLREGDRVTVTWAEGAALTLDHAKIVYGRCIAEPEREDKVAQADAAAGDFRAAMAARSCGG